MKIIHLTAALIITSYAVYLFVYLIRTRILFIGLGKESHFDKQLSKRFKIMLIQVFGQKPLFKDKKSGAIHFVFFYGFILVQFGAIDFIWKGITDYSHLPLGVIYPYFTFSQEMICLLILLAVVAAFYRRYIEKLKRLKRNFKAALVLLFIIGLMLSVLMGNGFFHVVNGQSFTLSEPVASILASGIRALGLSSFAEVGFYLFWWLHMLILLSFLVYIPQSKHLHLLVAPFNIFFARTGAPKLEALDLDDEAAETFGVGKIEDFQRKQLLDLYACVECGRCTNVCPANLTGKQLSPMDLITKLRDHLTNKGAAITSKQPWVPTFAFRHTQANQLATSGNSQQFNPKLIGEVITEEELWACTTCRNCEDQCPVANEHVDKIIDMRRYLVLTKGEIESSPQRALQNIERQDNPWGISRKKRMDWRNGNEPFLLENDTQQEKILSNIPTVQENPSFEYLFWVGSMGSFDKRSQKISLAFARLMQYASVSFAILGNDEKNSGDTPRRLGNEFLFQDLVQKNINIFRKFHVKKIVTIDPHAYHSFKNEYPDFGFQAEVLHHSELLAQLLQDGKLKPQYEVHEKITWHDSCYLGRYNQVYQAPREVLAAIPGLELIEMQRNRENAMCCGAGGGLMWMEETKGIRVNLARVEQALAVKPTLIGSACPYCLTMLSDGVKIKEVDDVQTFDIAELLERAIFSRNNTKE